MSQKTAQSFSVRHTKNAANKVEDIKQTLDSLRGDMMSIQTKLNFLAERQLNREAVASILDRLFPKTVKNDTSDLATSTRRENILADVLKLYESNDNGTFPEQAGTPYALLNAVTNYTDHLRSSKGDQRAESALFGSGDALKSKALVYTTESAQALPAMAKRQYFMSPDVSGTGSSLLDDVLVATLN